MKSLLKLVAAGGVLLLAGCTFQVRESNFIRPTPDEADAPSFESVFAGLPARAEALRITASDGAALHGVAFVQPQAHATVLYFGGNMARVSANGRGVAERLLPLGVNVVMFDHRGSGRSEGAPTVDLLLSDALAEFDFLTTKLGIAPDTIVVQGHSLGSFMAGHVARERNVGALVLTGSATTTEDWVAAIVPWYYKPFVRTKIDPKLEGRGNLAVVRKQRAPLLVIGGTRDEQAPPKLSRRLAAAAEEQGHPVTLVIARGAAHDELFAHPEVVAAYAKFIADVGGRSAQP